MHWFKLENFFLDWLHLMGCDFLRIFLWLKSVFLHRLNLIVHLHILNFNLRIKVDIDRSIKRKLLSWNFYSREVAQYADYDCHEETKWDQENQKVNEGVKRSFSSEFIEEALVFRNGLYLDSVSRHSRITDKALANIFICRVENGLDGLNCVRVLFCGSGCQTDQLGSFQITKHLTFIFSVVDLPFVFLIWLNI